MWRLIMLKAISRPRNGWIIITLFFVVCAATLAQAEDQQVVEPDGSGAAKLERLKPPTSGPEKSRGRWRPSVDEIEDTYYPWKKTRNV
jgi:hypothetical protein